MVQSGEVGNRYDKSLLCPAGLQTSSVGRLFGSGGGGGLEIKMGKHSLGFGGGTPDAREILKFYN